MSSRDRRSGVTAEPRGPCTVRRAGSALDGRIDEQGEQDATPIVPRGRMLRIELEHARHSRQSRLRQIMIGFLCRSAPPTRICAHSTVKIRRRSRIRLDSLRLFRPPSSEDLCRLVHGLVTLDAVVLSERQTRTRRVTDHPWI